MTSVYNMKHSVYCLFSKVLRYRQQLREMKILEIIENAPIVFIHFKAEVQSITTFYTRVHSISRLEFRE